ncbi:hypothetical protein [Sporosarcina psychrophila]|uniref:Uncharacterized protein n=1 Tax=Sporosarcina psychrophila TaxID=1476 RepID=A0ABV2KF30_SPOPS
MEKEVFSYLHTLADVLRENDAVHLIEEIAKKDYQMAQVLEIMVRED